MLKKSMFYLLVLTVFFLAYRPNVTAQETVDVSSLKSLPVIADHEVRTYNRNNKTENSISNSKFYRDSAGRTRWDSNNIITIHDPVTRVTITLDSIAKTFHKLQWTPASTEKDVSVTKSIIEEIDLGTQSIEGLETFGREIVTTTVVGTELTNRTSIETTDQVWEAKQPKLPIKRMFKDSTGNSMIAVFKNIKVGIEPSSELFQIPSGYTDIAQIIPSSSKSNIHTNAVCPVNTFPATSGNIGYLHILPNGGSGGTYAEAYTCCNILATTATTSAIVPVANVYYSSCYSSVFFQSNSNGSTGYNAARAYFVKAEGARGQQQTKTIIVDVY